MKSLLYVLLLAIALGSDVDCNRQTFRPGLDFSCAIDNRFHHVHCWGYAVHRSFQFAPPADVEFVQIAAAQHIVGCGLSKEGRVYMWGRDHSEVITKTPTEADFIDVSCGVHHACAIKRDNTVLCWGLNNENRSTPPTNTYFQQIELGNDHSCGITISNTLKCWGNNGHSRASPPGGEFRSIRCGSDFCQAKRKSDNKLISWGHNGHGRRAAPSGWDVNPKQYDAGYYATCVINQENKLKCWGHDHYTMISGANKRAENEYKDVKLGHDFICALDMDNEWDCWGHQPDLEKMPKFYDWVNIDDCGRKIVEVSSFQNTFASGHGHACALDATHHVVCWGSGTFNIAPPTIQMKTIVSSQHSSYCGLTMENGVKCWGANDHSGLTSGVPDRKDLIAVTAGHDFGCAITQDYLVVCWGLHAEGREYVPVNEFYKIVENGMHATCGITFTGKIECWGNYNHHGMLNHPTDDTKQWVELHCNYGCCALDQDRRVTCWGYNSHREKSDAPTSLTNIKQLAAGLHHFCVLKEDDTIHCWGRNNHGESTNPSGNNWLALGDMGIYSSCAMTKDHEIQCWGKNDKQELNVPTGKTWLPPHDKTVQEQTWLEVGKGSCPEDDQKGATKTDRDTEDKCRDYCFDTHYETYFTLTTEDNGTVSCKCFNDCDSLDDQDNVVSYEVLSKHVAEDFQQERQLLSDYRLRFAKSLEKSSFLESTMATMNYELETTKKNLEDMTARKKMFEERFKHVKESEDAKLAEIRDNEFSKLAEEQYPSPIYDTSVGSGNVATSTSSHVFNWLTIVMAVGVGCGIGLFLSRKNKMRDEVESLL